MRRVEELELQVQTLQRELRALRAAASQPSWREEHLRLAIETSGIGVWRWEVATDEVHWDERLCAIFRLAPADAPRDYATWAARLHPDDRGHVEQQVRHAVARGEYPTLEHRILCGDGAVRWIHARGTVVRDEGGAIVRMIGAVLDVTERHAMEAELRDAQRVETVARLASNVAHNFNNLLAAVVPSLDEAARRVPESAVWLEPAREASRQAAVIVRALTRSMGGDSTRARAPHDLGALLVKTTELCRSTFDRWIRWDIDVARDLPRVSVEPSQIERALVNVLLNARDALRSAPGRDPCIAVSAARSGARVCVVIRDSGPGMDDATRARVFEPFFTTKGHALGGGLGLSTAYAIAREHGGTLTCHTALGEGASFTLALPIDDTVETAHEVTARAALYGRGERVLVVDDEPLLRRVLRTVLEGAGYDVSEAADGDEAIAMLLRDDARYDVMVLDRSMPGRDGHDVMAWVTRERAALPVVGCSGLDAPMEGVRAMLSKPVEPDVLLGTVRAVLDLAASPQEVP